MGNSTEEGTALTTTTATARPTTGTGSGVAAANLHLIAQGVDLLARIDPRVYTAPPPVPMGTIGGHFRHCLEFFERFLAGFEDGRVDYDARERDPRVEVDPLHARDRLAAVAERLRALPESAADRALDAVHDRDGDGSSLDEAPAGRSSVRRELDFLASHTTHHYALIGALMRLHGAEPGADFGVAASTLAHRRRSLVGGGLFQPPSSRE